MFLRRHFLIASGAAAALPVLPSVAQAGAPAGWTIPEDWNPVIVRLQTPVPAGDIHVDPNSFSLYLGLTDGRAIRYRVGIGRSGLYESGTFILGNKARWPSWRPTNDMIRRAPDRYARYANGMPGGPNNPLGARALYLHTDAGLDTYLRIHGTTEPWTIGSAVSNGCVRLVNAHVEHLYDQATVGARVVLHPVATSA
ncbi:MAG: L,D-transpeptidase [Rhodobacteraceae bacterium]|jgi:lipoprotein-anchoring transpeptidase ErfK/SrfK|nr:L,D-transpeptidase [Paracoccaceae bacterium]